MLGMGEVTLAGDRQQGAAPFIGLAGQTIACEAADLDV